MLIILVLVGQGCSQKAEQIKKGGLLEKPVSIKYAKGFLISEIDSGYILRITRISPELSDTMEYTLSHSPGIDEIQIPIESIVCTSTSHIPMLEYLEEEHLLVGFPNLDYISSEKTRNRIKQNNVKDIGNVQEMNLELLLELDPDVVLNYSLDDLRITNRMQQLGLDVILSGDYLENHPLGRAEWIKVYGILTGKLATADSIFQKIEQDYLSTKSLVDQQNKDHVFSGSLYGDAWFMPGGDNYAATLLKDAGYQYEVEGDTSNGFLQWGFENVFTMAKNYRYWIGPAPFEDLEALSKADERYTGFRAFKEGNVYTYDNRIGETGGNEYLELGYLRPDIILKDLYKIRMPDALPEHELYFYRKLNR